MNHKKPIEKLFQERFKDFEATPKEHVWQRIETQLKQKEDRKIIPLWWQYAGVAALLLLFFTMGKRYFTAPEIPNEIIVKTPKPETQESKETFPKEENYISKPNDNKESNSPKIQSGTGVGVKTIKQNTIQAQTPVLNTVAKQQPSAHKTETNNTLESNIIETQLASPSTVISGHFEDTNINHSNFDKTQIENVKETDNATPLSIEDAIATNTNNADKTEASRWEVKPTVAPVYFNTIGEGSSIDQEFNKNNKTGNINMSYGINTSYAINSKIKIRTGINAVNLGYNTNDVIVYQTIGQNPAGNSLKQVSRTSKSNADVKYSAVSSDNVAKNALLKSINTSITQALGFIEVPVEMEYKLINKSIGVNVIGGFSTLFLNKNEVYSNANNGEKTFLGEATNINNTSYSANIGLGINYKITKSINVNLEPVFKYQINTFNQTSGNFMPFFVGVYSGLAVHF